VNASVGRYYKLPPYTILGFRAPEAGNALVNRDAKYIRSDHLVAGLEFLPATATRFTVEGFYKRYANYPVSARNGISLANLGGDFAVLGNEAVRSTGPGPVVRGEFLVQQKLTKNFYGILAYTLYRSQFTGRTGAGYRVGLGQPPPGFVHGRLPVSAQLGTGGAVPLPGRPALHPSGFGGDAPRLRGYRGNRAGLFATQYPAPVALQRP
jgi:hypothetical protein